MSELNRRTDIAHRGVYALNSILGYSQEQIAKRLGVSFTTVSAWATGRRKPHAKQEAAIRRLVDVLTATARDSDERLRSIVARLHVEYGSPHLNNKSDPLDELFFILLSLKTSHRTYEATYDHFAEEFRPWSTLLSADPAEVERHIKSGGLGSIKSRAFIDIARRLQDDFGAVTLSPLLEMPDSAVEEYLMSLPGVGVKTARCVALYSLGRNTLPVDSHTYRVGARLGLVPTSTTTKKVHDNFDAVVPRDLSYSLHTNFVAHGRAVCQDPIPQCAKCLVAPLCPYPKQRAVSEAEVRQGPIRVGERASTRKRVRPDVLRAVDLYAGAGGLSLGLEEAGFRLGYALDWDKHACATHARNFKNTTVECRDIRGVSGKHIELEAGGRIDLLAGGPNCQGVSQRGLRNPDDPRNLMLKEYIRLVSELRPQMFLFENVPGLAHRHNFGLLQDVFGLFEEIGYRCSADVLLAADFGVPQLRYRFFMVGVLDHSIPISFPAPTHQAKSRSGEGLFGLRPYVSVWDAIGDLPAIEADHQDDVPMEYPVENPANEFLQYARAGSDILRNHACSATEKVNLDRARHIPAGGNWKDIPAELLPERLFSCRMTDHSTTYARLGKDHPSFTITSLFGNITAGAFTHPEQTRALSIREGARLQSFPDRFVFEGPRNSQYRQIGNAVPVLLARAVASHLHALLRGENPRGLAPRITPEVFNDPRAWDALPVLTPRFRALFGAGTRWPRGWGAEPSDYSTVLDRNYSLRDEFLPEAARGMRRRLAAVGAEEDSADE